MVNYETPKSATLILASLILVTFGPFSGVTLSASASAAQHSHGVIDHVTIAMAYASDNSTLIDAHNSNRYHVRWDLGYSDTTYYQDKFKNTIAVP